MNLVLGNWRNFSTNELRLKPQYTQNKGFFCSLTWLLECLPYIEANQYPSFGIEFYSHNYGSYPNFSVFGKHLINHFPAIQNPINSMDVNDIRKRNNEVLQNNFEHSHNLFFKYFDFSPEIYAEASTYSDLFKGKKILGLHYRGTDKLGVNWADHTSVDDFIEIVKDYLLKNSVGGIYFCTDSLQFKTKMISIFSNTYPLYYNKNQSINENALHISRLTVIEHITKPMRRHNNDKLEKQLEQECIINERELKEVITDCIVLSRCSTVIKTHSLVSSFSKIINPNLNIYRVNGCSELYYPESYIPFYSTRDPKIQIILNNSKKLPF